MVLNGVSEIGQYDVVALNRGTRDGIQPGHVLEVYAGGTKHRDEVRQGEVDWNWRGESPLTSEFWYGNDHEVAGWLRTSPAPTPRCLCTWRSANGAPPTSRPTSAPGR